jgi:transposase InsO family protein
MNLPGMPGTIRGIGKRAKKESWNARPRSGKGGGLEYHLTSLPEAARNELVRRAQPPLLALPAPVSTALVVPKPAEIDLAARKAEGDALAAHLRGNAQARMDAKRELLAAIIRAKQFGDLNIMTAVADYNAGRLEVSPETRARIPTTSLPSVHRWFSQLHGYGLSRLGGRYGHRLGSGIIDTYPQLAAALQAFILEYPHGQAKRAHEWLQARYDLDWSALPAELAGDGPIPMPSPKTVARWIDRWKADHAALYERFRNPDAWKNRYMIGWGDMSAHLTHPNQLWEFDSTPADVMLDDGRHSILGVIDLYTRRVQLHISQTSKAAAVAHLTKKALRAWGVPGIAKTDNGQDYVSKHINRLFYALGIEHQVSAPFSPWQKPFIERFFRTFSHDLIELLPGYLGHNVADRQALRAKQQFSDRLFVKDHTVEFKGLTAAGLQAFCERWIAAYETRPHTGLGGQTPHAVAAAYPEPAKRIQDERVLNLLLQEVPGDGWRTVTAAYGIRIENHEYLGGDLVPWVGQRIRVLYDPEDAGLIYCLDDKDQFIGRAECPELTGTSRAQLAKACTLAQRQSTKDGAAAARRAAKPFFPKDAAETILNAREQRLVVWPPVEAARSEPYTTPAIDGAAQALLPPPEKEIIEVSPERQEALRQEMAALAPSPLAGEGRGGGADRPTDFDSPWARVRWTFALVLNEGRPRETISAIDRAYVRTWFARKPSLEKSMPGQFADEKRQHYEELRAWFLSEPSVEESPDLKRAVG